MHKNSACDGCDMNPIVGIRYKCTVRDNYDLCEQCEKKLQENPHPMLKIRQPSQAPKALYCLYKDTEIDTTTTQIESSQKNLIDS